MTRYKLKPCVGCGESYKIPKDTLCYICNGKLADYDRLKASCGLERSRLFGFDNQPPIPNSRGVCRNSQEVQYFASAVKELIDGLSPIIESNKGITITGEIGRAGLTTIAFSASSDFDDRYRKFNNAICRLLNKAFDKGQERGQQLLMQLNSGEITLSHFERKLKDAEGGR